LPYIKFYINRANNNKNFDISDIKFHLDCYPKMCSKHNPCHKNSNNISNFIISSTGLLVRFILQIEGHGSFEYYVILRGEGGVLALLCFIFNFSGFLTNFFTGKGKVSKMIIFSVTKYSNDPSEIISKFELLKECFSLWKVQVFFTMLILSNTQITNHPKMK